jgi:hypothetical protein
MAAPQINFYESFGEYLQDGTFDMNSNSFKMTLHTSTYTPSASGHSVYANLTNELSTANGYTNGGLALTSVTLTRTALNDVFTSAAPVWTASGGSIVCRYGVIRAVGTLNARVDPLVCWILLDSAPADVTTTATNTLTVTPHATNGWYKSTCVNA